MILRAISGRVRVAVASVFMKPVIGMVKQFSS